jgi:hypothetical protein
MLKQPVAALTMSDDRAYRKEYLHAHSATIGCNQLCQDVAALESDGSGGAMVHCNLPMQPLAEGNRANSRLEPRASFMDGTETELLAAMRDEPMHLLAKRVEAEV